LLGWMCPDGIQYRQGSPDAPDTTRCGVLVQDAQDAQDAGSRLGESGRNTTRSDAGHLFADVVEMLSKPLYLSSPGKYFQIVRYWVLQACGHCPTAALRLIATFVL